MCTRQWPRSRCEVETRWRPPDRVGTGAGTALHLSLIWRVHGRGLRLRAERSRDGRLFRSGAGLRTPGTEERGAAKARCRPKGTALHLSPKKSKPAPLKPARVRHPIRAKRMASGCLQLLRTVVLSRHLTAGTSWRDVPPAKLAVGLATLTGESSNRNMEVTSFRTGVQT